MRVSPLVVGRLSAMAVKWCAEVELMDEEDDACMHAAPPAAA